MSMQFVYNVGRCSRKHSLCPVAKFYPHLNYMCVQPILIDELGPGHGFIRSHCECSHSLP